MEQTLQEIIDYIQTIKELSVDEKKEFVSMMENGGDPVEVLDKVEDAIQGKIDNAFQEAGVTLDEKDPEYQAEHKKMMDEIQSAEDELNAEMNIIDNEAAKIQDDASQGIDDVKMEAIRSKMSE